MGRNNYFQFKQFRVNQEHSAMKVGIDGVLLGAWANVDNCNTILDIGTGTGLIALMLAQRTQARITAIEIEKNAAKEATENVAQSPWKDRVEVQHVSLQKFVADTTSHFDLIVSNPPFFQNSLKAKNESRSLARHSDSLPYKVLLNAVAHLLTEEGRCAFIFPESSLNEITNLARINKLHITRITRVSPNKQKPTNRILIEMGKKEVSTTSNFLSIYNPDGSWNATFKQLTRKYYLNF